MIRVEGSVHEVRLVSYLLVLFCCGLCSESNMKDYKFYNKELYHYFKQFGIGAPNKKMTNDIFNLPDEYLKCVIKGLIEWTPGK